MISVRSSEMKKTIARVASAALILALGLAAVLLINPSQPKERRIYAQFVGAAYPPGFNAAAGNTSAYQPTLVANAGALSVTNPASNGIVNIAAGQVFCFNGGLDSAGQSSMTLVLPSSGVNTYLLVYNCVSNLIYAKTAVTAPGGTPSPNQPGIPGTFLAPIPQVEVPLALVVCNSTSCGNSGGTSSITDQRPAPNFTVGHTNQAIASTDFAGTKAASAGTMTYTFTNAFISAPICVVSDQTSISSAGLKAATTTTTLTVTGATTTDVIAWVCVGAPN
jgi:hypothetical protein